MQALRLYNQLLERQPLLTKCATSGALFFAGDTTAQCVSAKGWPDRYDWARSRRMGLYGGLVFAPLAHSWFWALEKWMPGTGRILLVKKVAADQMLYTPPINISFFMFTSLAAGSSFSDATGTVREKLWPTLKVNWTVWPVAQAVNFALVPLQLRVLFVNVVALGWSMFLSSMANGTDDIDPALPEAALEFAEAVEVGTPQGEVAE